MRLNILITCAALAAVSIITTFIITLTTPATGQPTEPAPISTGSPAENIPQTSRVAQPTSPYILREFEGRLAVYFNDEPNPQKVFDVYTSTLPPYDRGQLQQGVAINSYEELVQRIEDYIS